MSFPLVFVVDGITSLTAAAVLTLLLTRSPVVPTTFGEMIYFPTAVAHTAELAPEGKTGEYMGLFSGVMSVSMVVGPWLGTFLLDRTGAPATWAAMFLLGTVAAVAIRFSPSPERSE